MGKNLKIYSLESKENFLLYLRRLIRSTYAEMKTLKIYTSELKDFIEKNEYNENPTAKINPKVYINYNDKINNVTGTLLNLIGDHTNSAMSYKKFRAIAKRKMDNGLDLGLKDLSKEIDDILTQINVDRNWSLHIPESLFTAELEIADKMRLDGHISYIKPDSTIRIVEFDYYEAAWLTDFLRETENLTEAFSKVFQQMKRDYSILVGESVRIEISRVDVRPIKDMDIPKMSMKIQNREYKGIDNEIWIPEEFI